MMWGFFMLLTDCFSVNSSSQGTDSKFCNSANLQFCNDLAHAGASPVLGNFEPARKPEQGQAASGLVPFSTSEKCHLVDSQASRLSRMKSGVMTATRLITSELEAIKGIRYRPWMITPTYRPGVEYSPRHISSLLGLLRKWASRHDFILRYVWVAEIQGKRFNKGDALLGECVHYHLLVWVPARLTLPKPDKQGWWRHGMTQRILVNKPISYMLKYASKGGAISFPPGLRLHGCGGLSDSARSERTWWLLPRWVRSLWSISDCPRRAASGGFVLRSTGEWFPSIWRVVVNAGNVMVELKENLSEYFSDDHMKLLNL